MGHCNGTTNHQAGISGTTGHKPPQKTITGSGAEYFCSGCLCCCCLCAVVRAVCCVPTMVCLICLKDYLRSSSTLLVMKTEFVIGIILPKRTCQT